MHDKGSATKIRLGLPGVDPNDVAIQAIDDTIEVSGEKRPESEAKIGDRYRSERTFGSFFRAFTMPSAIDPDKVEATFDKGVC